MRIIDKFRYDFSQSFDVLVEPERKRFSVYYDILTERSGFLKAARSSRWIQDSQQPTDLTDLDPEVFSNYLQLVYTGKYIHLDANSSSFPEATGLVASHPFYPQMMALVKLYVLADKLGDLTSMNLAMDEFITIHQQSPVIVPFLLMAWIYKFTPPSSPLRTVVRNIVLFEADFDFYKDEKTKQLPVELLLDVLREDSRLKESNPDKPIAELYNVPISGVDKCRYHQHDDEHPRCT